MLERKIAFSATFLMLITATGVSPSAFAWEPSGPIKMMIAARAGGGVDTQARLIGAEIEKRKGWKIIPQSQASAGGLLLARKMLKEPKDGLSIGMIVSATLGYNMLATKKAGYSLKDFTLLTTVSGSQMGLISKSDKGWKTLRDVIASAKQGKVLRAGAMSQKLADGLYLLAQANNVKFNTVMLKGGKGVMNAVLAGDIDFGWAAGIQTRAVKAGDLVNLASGEKGKLKISPAAPLLSEFGVPYSFGVDFMFVAPAGIPVAARDALTKAIVEVVRDPSTKAHKFITRAFGGPKLIYGKALESHIKKAAEESRKLLASTAG